MTTLSRFGLVIAVLLAACLVPSAALAQRSTPVTVINDASNPVPVITDQELRMAVAYGQFRGIPTSDRVAGDDFIVPAGATLVIERLTLRSTMALADQVGFVEARVTTSGDTISHVFPVATDQASLPAGSTQKIASYAWSTRLYADPGSEVLLNLNSIEGSPGGVVVYTLSGYLVPAGSPGLGP